MYKYSYYSGKLLDGFLYCFKQKIVNIHKARTGSIYFDIRFLRKTNYCVNVRISNHWQNALRAKTLYVTVDKDSNSYKIVVCIHQNIVAYKEQIDFDEKLIITKIFRIYKKYKSLLKRKVK